MNVFYILKDHLCIYITIYIIYIYVCVYIKYCVYFFAEITPTEKAEAHKFVLWVL